MERAPSLTFAMLLRRYRQAAGLSQEELAEQAGLSARTVGDLERGASHAPRKDTVELLAPALGLGAPERAALAEAARRLSTTSSSLPIPAGTSSPPLVGRRELALLEQHLRGQGPPVLLLAGEPGIGKTCLLHAALPRATGHGLRVLEGAASGGVAMSPTPRSWGPCSTTSGTSPPPSNARSWRAAPGWCACCPSWPPGRSSPCRRGPCRPSRSGG